MGEILPQGNAQVSLHYAVTSGGFLRFCRAEIGSLPIADTKLNVVSDIEIVGLNVAPVPVAGIKGSEDVLHLHEQLTRKRFFQPIGIWLYVAVLATGNARKRVIDVCELVRDVGILLPLLLKPPDGKADKVDRPFADGHDDGRIIIDLQGVVPVFRHDTFLGSGNDRFFVLIHVSHEISPVLDIKKQEKQPAWGYFPCG